MKNTLISLDFKLRFIFKFCVLTVLGGILFSGFTLYFCSGSLTTFFEDGRVLIKETHLSVLPKILYTNLIMWMLAVITIIPLTFYVFSRISGPFVRLHSDLLAIEQVDLCRMDPPKCPAPIRAIAPEDLRGQLRYPPDGQAKIISEKINFMIASFSSKIRDVESELSKIIVLAAADELVPDTTTLELIRLHGGVRGIYLFEDGRNAINKTADRV